MTDRINVKQWLSRARNIDREINALLKVKEDTYDRILHITQSYTTDVVTGTKDPHKFDRIAELESMIDKEIDNLVAVKAEIESAIFKLSDGRYREVLRLRYIEGKTFEQISVDLNYSWRQTCRLHGRALIKMEEVLNAGRM